MRLRKKPKKEDLRWIYFWVDGDSMEQWPTKNGKPIDPETGELWKLDGDGNAESRGNQPFPEKIGFGLRMLLGKDTTEMNDKVFQTSTTLTAVNTRRGRGSRSQAVTEQSFQYGMMVRLKLSAAIVQWEGICDEDGKPVPVTEDFIMLLPAWITDTLLDEINAMSGIQEEELGE